jgi:hypothetical protein
MEALEMLAEYLSGVAAVGGEGGNAAPKPGAQGDECGEAGGVEMALGVDEAGHLREFEI